MRTIVQLTAAVAILIGMGIAHGRLTDRWGVPAEVPRVAAKLTTVPTEIAGWTSSERPIPEDQLKVAGAEGSLSREYVDPESGVTVLVSIVCGRPGPISLHEPTVCFVNAGMEQRNDVARTSIRSEGQEHSFSTADFKERGIMTGTTRAYWSWSRDTKSWSAPNDPRRAFAGTTYLYKLYFLVKVQALGAESAEETDERAIWFMQEFLKTLPQNAAPDAGEGGGPQA